MSNELDMVSSDDRMRLRSSNIVSKTHLELVILVSQRPVLLDRGPIVIRCERACLPSARFSSDSGEITNGSKRCAQSWSRHRPCIYFAA